MSGFLPNNEPTSPDDDIDGLLEFYKSQAMSSSRSSPVVVQKQQSDSSMVNIESQCSSYLDDQICQNSVHLDTGEHFDVLDIDAKPDSHTIQQIIDDHNRDLNIIHFLPPIPRLLPIRISDIVVNDDSYIIPSDTINIEGFLFNAPRYRLEAVICMTNRRRIVYLRHWPTKQWYYYQSNCGCTRLENELSEILNSTIESRSIAYQKQMVESAHLLLTVIFRNAIKYFYKPMM